MKKIVVVLFLGLLVSFTACASNTEPISNEKKESENINEESEKIENIENSEKEAGNIETENAINIEMDNRQRILAMSFKDGISDDYEMIADQMPVDEVRSEFKKKYDYVWLKSHEVRFPENEDEYTTKDGIDFEATYVDQNGLYYITYDCFAFYTNFNGAFGLGWDLTATSEPYSDYDLSGLEDSYWKLNSEAAVSSMVNFVNGFLELSGVNGEVTSDDINNVELYFHLKGFKGIEIEYDSLNGEYDRLYETDYTIDGAREIGEAIVVFGGNAYSAPIQLDVKGGGCYIDTNGFMFNICLSNKSGSRFIYRPEDVKESIPYLSLDNEIEFIDREEYDTFSEKYQQETYSIAQADTDERIYEVKVAAPDGYVNLRAGAGTDNTILCEIMNEEILPVYEEDGKWLYTKYGDTYGWVAASQVEKYESEYNRSSLSDEDMREVENSAADVILVNIKFYGDHMPDAGDAELECLGMEGDRYVFRFWYKGVEQGYAYGTKQTDEYGDYCNVEYIGDLTLKEWIDYMANKSAL